MILPGKGVSRFPTLNTRNDITSPDATVSALRLLTASGVNKRVKMVWQAESVTGFQMGTDSLSNGTDNFWISCNATGTFPLTISANDIITLGTATAGGKVLVSSVLGISCPGAGASSERFGAGSIGTGASSVAVGNAANADAANTVAVGAGAIAVGSACVAIGQGSTPNGASSIAIGRQSTTNFSRSICLGANSADTAAQQFVVGGLVGAGDITQAYFGAGVTSTAPPAVGLNATGGSGTNIAGASLTLAGGRGTGSAVGGAVIFQSTIAGASATTLRTLQEKARLSNVGVWSHSQESTVQTRTVLDVTPSFVVATDASRTGRAVWQVYDTAAREALRMEASGAAAMIGFLGSAAVAQQVGASAAGIAAILDANAKAAITALQAALAAYGLVTSPA